MALANITNNVLTDSGTTVESLVLASRTLTINGVTYDLTANRDWTLSTSNVGEGTNLYYTTARANTDFDTRLATKSTSNLSEGTNLYYTDARVGTYLTNNSYATQTYVNTAVSNLVDAAPGTLDTLNELAAALGDDPNFATTVATSIGTKEPIITAGTTSQYWRGDKSWQTLPIYTLSGLGGQPQLNGTGFVKVSGTTVSYDNSTYYLASNPNGYITSSALSGYLPLSGGTLTGVLNLLASQFYDQSVPSYGLDAKNSDIIGLNGLYFNDPAETPWEGLNWYNTSTTWDSLWSASGVLYYTPNRATTTVGTSYTIYHTGNLSNPVTGTGTANYLPKWTNGSAISNSVITDNGTTVGINDVSANNSILSIKGNWVSGYATVKTYPITGVASGGASGYGIFDSDGNTRLAFFAVNSGAVEVWGQQNTPMHFATNNSIKMVLTTGGILGVNTLTPTSVAGGGIEIFEDTNGGTLSLSRDAGNQRGILRFGRNNGGTFQTAARIIGDSDGGTGANGSLYFQVSNSSSSLINALQIASTGAATFISSVTATSFIKVGGTSAQYLKADGSVSTLTNPVTGTGVTQGVAYWTSTSEISSEADFAYEASNNRVRINSNAWDSAGAEAKLIVSGVLTAGSSATVQINGFVRIKDQLLIHNGANTAQDAYIQAVGQGVLTVGNKLLINTTTVGSYQLDVRGSASNVARFVAGSGDALVRVIANDYNTEATARFFLGENDTLGMTFEYDGVNNYGHIGMNDSVDPTGAFSKRISMPRFNTDTLFNAGNVGIGVASPSFKLDVNGTGRFSGRLYADSNITFSGYIQPSSNVGYGVKSANGTVLQEWYDGATYNYGSFVNSGSVTANSLVIRNSGVPAAQFYRNLDVTVVGAAGQGIEFGARSGSTFISGASIYGVLDNPATTGSIVFQTLTAGSLSTKLTIASTGAATFSSSVTAAQLVAKAGNGNQLILDNSAERFTQINLQNNATQKAAIWWDNTNTELVLLASATGTGHLKIASTGAATFSNSVGIGASPANTMLQIQGDWVSGFSTLRLQGSASNQVGIGLYNTSGQRRSVWAYTGSYVYWETEANTNITISPNGIFRGTFYANGTIGLGGGTTGVSQEDIFINPTSGSPAVYIGRLSSTNDDNTKVYFQNRVGTTTLFVDPGNRKVGIGLTTPTALYNIGLEIFDDTGGGTLTLSRNAGGQRGVLRYGRNNGGSFQETARIISNSDTGTGANGNLYFQTTNSAGTMLDRMILFPNNRVAINDTSANGVLQISGGHIGGYGMLNMNSVDSCIISMDSSGSYDVRLRYKYNGTDLWFAGMVTDNTWRLTKGDNTAVLYATQGNNVYIPNGGLQIASEGGFTGSAKFLVGAFLSSGSGAIAQFNGFVRLRDSVIIHQDSNTVNESYLRCTGSNELTVGGTFKAIGDVIAYSSSDLRFKNNLVRISNPLNKISAISGYEFDWNDKQEVYSGHDVGVVAQEIEQIFPELVSTRQDGYKAVKYDKLAPLFIEAIKEQQAQIESQKTEIEELKDLVKQLINR